MKNSKILLRSAVLIFASLNIMLLTSCGKAKDQVKISVWSDERNAPVIEEGIEKFKELHKKEVDIEYTISLEGEVTIKDMVLSDVENAADLYAFADDQFNDLYKAGALLEITDNVDGVLAEVGGREAGVADIVTVDGKMYAYPETAGNGYFLYYNKAYFTEDDVKSLDRILEICRKNNKKFTYDFSSGWYLYGFFRGAGMTLGLNEDGTANICDWNRTDGEYTGSDVAEALLKITEDPGFISLGDDGFLAEAENGNVIAGVNGPWNAEKIQSFWGDNYAAAKLPTYTVKGNQVQMYSFMGYKLLGINSTTKNPEWCMKLAEYLTNEENQLKRFEVIGESPVNVKAAQDERVKAAPAVAALAEQSRFSNVQSVAAPFWDASQKLGVTLAAGNPDGRDLQELLDDMVKEATAKAE